MRVIMLFRRVYLRSDDSSSTPVAARPPGQPRAMQDDLSCIVVSATNAEDPGMDGIDNLDLTSLELINRAINQQITQMGISQVIQGRQQRQLWA